MSQVPARGPMRSGARLRLRVGDPAVLTASLSEADKRREEREIAREQREEAKEKREERTAKRSGLVAAFAVVVTLVGSCATATVAIMSMRSTQASAEENIRSAAEQASTAFLRDQKKSAYANFYSAAMDVRNAEITLARLFAKGLPLSMPDSERSNYYNSEFESRRQVLDEKLVVLDAAYPAVYMSGNASVVALAEELRTWLENSDIWSARQDALFASLYRDDWERMKAAGLYQTAIVDQGYAKRFLDAVREDYGQDPVG